MKKLIATLFIALMLNTGLVQAHGEHGKVSSTTAKEIALKATQQLTFKDLGFSIGQLNGSWKNVSAQDYKLYSETGNRYVISALNKESNETIYFLMSMSGEVLQVSSEAKF